MHISKIPKQTGIFFPVLLIGFLIAFTLNLNAQSIERQLISSTGHLSQTEHLTVSATAGETVIQTATIEEIILTQGFQQPNENDFVGIWEINDIQIEISIAPNPVTSCIYLTMIADAPMDIKCSVFRMDGTMVMPLKRWEVLGESIQKIDFTPLPAGSYLISLSSPGHKKVQTYKIIKQW
ncbi:MAG: T9SS C-terminal target domain-containing protein [Bacteroidetes bacterium]|nr:MAG: T9SS C-terminal target domain-containing protein [Bacteroidota bacterium]